MPTFRHGRNTRVLVNGYDLSNTFRDASVATTVDTAETTAFLSTFKTYVPGMMDGRLTLGGMFAGDANSVDEVLNNIFGQEGPYVVTYAPEGVADPSGNSSRRTWGHNAHLVNYQVSGSVGDMVSTSAEFQGTAGVKSGPSLRAHGTGVTATGTNNGYDDTRSSTNGGWMAVQMVTNDRDAGSIEIKVQSSPNGTTSWVDVTGATTGSIAAGGGATAVVATVASGVTINRYLRATWTVTGGTTGTYDFFVGFYRGL